MDGHDSLHRSYGVFPINMDRFRMKRLLEKVLRYRNVNYEESYLINWKF